MRVIEVEEGGNGRSAWIDDTLHFSNVYAISYVGSTNRKSQ